LGKYLRRGVGYGIGINPITLWQLQFCPECSCLLVKKGNVVLRKTTAREDFSLEYSRRYRSAKACGIVILSLFCPLIFIPIICGVGINGEYLIDKMGIERNLLWHFFVGILLLVFLMGLYACFKIRCPNCNSFHIFSLGGGFIFKEPPSYCIKCGVKLR
jgi:hypothetical protein